MAQPIRSFTLASGLRNSHLTSTVAPSPADTRLSLTRGVFPIVCSMFVAYLGMEASPGSGSIRLLAAMLAGTGPECTH